MKSLLTTLCCFLSAVIFCTAQVTCYVNANNWLLVYPDHLADASVKAVRLSVYNDRIIRVTSSPQHVFTDRESLVVIQQPVQKGWDIKVVQEDVLLSTGFLIARVNIHTGVVSFTDAAGKLLLKERTVNGKKIEPVIEEGKQTYTLRQVFESDPQEAYYGLGQHQDDSWNYKGKKVIFFQNNTEVAVPFLVSVKN